MCVCVCVCVCVPRASSEKYPCAFLRARPCRVRDLEIHLLDVLRLQEPVPGHPHAMARAARVCRKRAKGQMQR